MRFGMFIPQGWRFDLVGVEPAEQWRTMLDVAHHLEANPAWESLWVYDHFHTTPVPSREATHEAWSLMSAFAASTSRLRLGQMCTCMAYRNPAYLAKVAATVDGVSGGRLEMGIGAGWYEHEWRAYGYGFPDAPERLRALREGVQIFRQMWTEGESTFAGKHYTTDGAICAPQPLQGTVLPGSPHNGIPMWIAGGGEKVTLKIAAQYADYTNFDGTPATFARKSAILAEHCAKVGRDFDEIVRTSNYNVVIGTSEAEVTERLEFIGEQLRRGGVPDKVAQASVENLRTQPAVGTPEQVAEALTTAQGLGMSYAITYFAEAAYDRSGIELFEREVMPALA